METIHNTPTTFFYSPFVFNVISDGYWFYPGGVNPLSRV